MMHNRTREILRLLQNSLEPPLGYFNLGRDPSFSATLLFDLSCPKHNLLVNKALFIFSSMTIRSINVLVTIGIASHI